MPRKKSNKTESTTIVNPSRKIWKKIACFEYKAGLGVRLINEDKDEDRLVLVAQVKSQDSEDDDDEAEEDPLKDPIIFSSCSYHLISGHKQVVYVPCSTDIFKCIRLFEYPMLPVCVDKDKCLLRVESSSVSYVDLILAKSRGLVKGFSAGVLGCDVVGTVIIPGPESDFLVGERVATMILNGGNARFAVQSSSKLIRIHPRDNPHVMCAILSAYLPAFATLHCRSYEDDNHRGLLLMGRKVFVNGGMSLHGQALIELAKLLGADQIYATAKMKDFSHLQRLGAVPVSHGSVKPYEKRLRGSMDFVVDFTTKPIDMFRFLGSIVEPTKGTIVYSEHGNIDRHGKHGEREKSLYLLTKILMTPNTFTFNHLRHFAYDFETFKKDFYHLRELTRSHAIAPNIRTIKLSQVGTAHVQFEYNNVRGCITCDPFLE